jgi:putative hydrolase of the HAD superfamily
MLKQYKHLFFDLDHTLWDFEANHLYTLEQVYRELHLDQHGIQSFTEFADSYMAHNEILWAKFRNGFIKREELRWKRFWLTLVDFKIADSNLAHELSDAYLEILPNQNRLVPGAKEILEHCQGRYEIHLITNGFEATQWQKLHYSGISPYFKEVITSEKSQSMKPQSAIFDYALRATGASAEESIMIGDALDIDILGAFYAGWDQVYYNPHNKPHNHKPTYEIRSLSELTSIF